MARPTRIDLPGGWYHVLNRGIEKRSIYRSDRCRERFVELLSQLPERFGIRLHSYVLMTNHYHLQVETQEANLSRAIHWLNAGYGIWFNRKHNRVGPLFQGRFKAILHDSTEALTINRYIRLSPVTKNECVMCRRGPNLCLPDKHPTSPRSEQSICRTDSVLDRPQLELQARVAFQLEP
jgi:putative transposase